MSALWVTALLADAIRLLCNQFESLHFSTNHDYQDLLQQFNESESKIASAEQKASNFKQQIEDYKEMLQR